MDDAQKSLVNQLKKTARSPAFWFILALLVLITIIHYEEAFEQPSLIAQFMSNLGFTRHALDRILYLAPIVWAGFVFGWKGAILTSVVALGCMLPRALIISPKPLDSIFETTAVFIIANVLAISFSTLRKEREYRNQLEITQHELKASEQRYRGLFENAYDAIWIQDMEGNILAANEATSRITGYDMESLVHMKVTGFLPEEGLEIAREIRGKLIRGEAIDRSYEQRVIRKDGTDAFLQLSSSLIRSDGKPIGFQHIARDFTQEKRMRENLHYVLEQTTRAQEEERKRISRELHDDTIQSLVVLSRQLDTLASSEKGMSGEDRQHLENLWQQTNNIIQGVRRLSQDLRPAALDRLGLLSALEWLASDIEQFSKIVTKVNVVGELRRLPEEIELVLFRIAQEALRNIWRHSQASRAEITLEFKPTKTRMTISDNGKGFHLPSTMGDLARDGKLGLAGMQERAQLLGGTLKVESRQPEGSKIIVDLPV